MCSDAMRDAIGYIRVSSEEQVDSGLGLEAQRQRIAAYWNMKGLHLAEVVEDPGVSCGKPVASRPAGRNMLVAPVYEKGTTSRDVYLPAGTWYDWWDNARHNGGTTVTRKLDLATMPIYVRAGSIIPFDPVRQYLAQPVTEPTTLKVYSGANGEFTMYDDDGISQDYLQNKGTWTKLSWDDGAKTLTISAVPPAGVTNASTAAREFRVEMLSAGTVKTVTYNGRQAEVTY